MAPEDRGRLRATAYRGDGLRLSTGLVAGRALGDLQLVPGRCHRAVGARFAERRHSAAHAERRREYRAAILARRQAHCVHLDPVQQALSRIHGRFRRRQALEHQALDRRAPERFAALLLQPVRPRDQPGLDPRRPRHHLRLQSQSYLRHRRILAHGCHPERGGSRSRRGSRRHGGRRRAGVSRRGNELEGATGSVSRRLAAGVQLLPRARLAQSVAAAGGRRGCLTDRLRRLGHDLSALVAGREAHRLRLEQERGYGNRSHRGAGGSGAIAARARSPLPASNGAAASRYPGCRGTCRLGTHQRHRCGRPVLCAVGGMDSCGRRLRSEPTALRSALFSCAG